MEYPRSLSGGSVQGVQDMMWILLALFSTVLIVTSVRVGKHDGMGILAGFSGVCTVVLFSMTVFMMTDCIEMSYNMGASEDAIRRHNDEILRQIRPTVLRNSSEDMVRMYGDGLSGMVILSQQGDLVDNRVLQKQVEILVDNQKTLHDMGIKSYRVKMYRVLLFAFWL